MQCLGQEPGSFLCPTQGFCHLSEVLPLSSAFPSCTCCPCAQGWGHTEAAFPKCSLSQLGQHPTDTAGLAAMWPGQASSSETVGWKPRGTEPSPTCPHTSSRAQVPEQGRGPCTAAQPRDCNGGQGELGGDLLFLLAPGNACKLELGVLHWGKLFLVAAEVHLKRLKNSLRPPPPPPQPRTLLQKQLCTTTMGTEKRDHSHNPTAAEQTTAKLKISDQALAYIQVLMLSSARNQVQAAPTHNQCSQPCSGHE